MYYSVFNLFKIGVGPSSSHTVGPMVAANVFLNSISNLNDVVSVNVDVYGSLALTGFGHATDKALLMGLEGQEPAKIDPEIIDKRSEEIREKNQLKLLGKKEIPFTPKDDMIFHMEEFYCGILHRRASGSGRGPYQDATRTADPAA